MKDKVKHRPRKVEPAPRPKPSARAQLERKLGHKLLTGQIPVVPPGQLPRCPIPPTHVKDFEGLCQDYADGKISEADVIAKVNETLRGLKKPESNSEGTQP